MHIEIFYWRSRSGVIHRGARIDDGARLTAEACNYDDAMQLESERVSDLIVTGVRDCERCLPPERVYSE